MTLRVSDLQSESDLDSVCNSCDVFIGLCVNWFFSCFGESSVFKQKHPTIGSIVPLAMFFQCPADSCLLQVICKIIWFKMESQCIHCIHCPSMQNSSLDLLSNWNRIQVSLRFWFVLGLGTIVAVTLYRCHEADFTNSTKKNFFL